MRQRESAFPVKGMFCPNCEKRIREALDTLPGVLSAQASYTKNRVSVTYDADAVSLSHIQERIREAGYEPAETESILRPVAILILLVSLYLIVSGLGWTRFFNLFPRAESSLSLAALFLTGCLTSVHCIAMCGGINLAQTTMAAKRGGKILGANLTYHAGRLLSYTAVGALAGGLGRVVSFGGKFKGIVALAAGAVMILMALNMLGLFRQFARFAPRFPAALYRKAAHVFEKRSSFLIGLLNGLMPCGPLQAVQLYALSTGSVLLGGASMFLFCLGTTPLLLSFGLFAGKLNRKHTASMLTVSACLIFLIGLHMISDGLALSGVSLTSKVSSSAARAAVQDGIQTVRTEIDYGSYPPIVVKKEIPVEWTLYVPEGKLNSCNGEILIPAYDVDVVLREGANLIFFYPTETGTIPYSCWMGMIKSSIEVID